MSMSVRFSEHISRTTLLIFKKFLRVLIFFLFLYYSVKGLTFGKAAGGVLC